MKENKKIDQDVLDRAVEWVNVNHPELDGEERDQMISETVTELELIDASADSEGV